MIRMNASTSSKDAKRYFSDGLSKSDYYHADLDQELGGAYGGRLAERLGLSGRITRTEFFALCDNRNPVSGNRLSPRTSSIRTVGYDLTFSVPKSVSIVHSLSNDSHILQIFQQCVSETMDIIEQDARTRVRKNGKDFDRVTGELLYASFVHQTARPVEGHAPDPHLHCHSYIFNFSYDPLENRIKAGQFQEINRKMPLYQNMFLKRLSDRLMDAGYGIRPTKNDFELEGVPQKVIDLFSKRKNEISKIAKEKGITDAKALDGLGAKTRKVKDKAWPN